MRSLLHRLQPRSGFTLVELLVVIAIIGVLVGLLLPAVQAAREAARRSTCTNNQKQIALALHNHHDSKGSFPRGMEQWMGGSGEITTQSPYTGTKYDKRRWSWFFRVLPYVEQQRLYDQQFDWYYKNATFGDWPSSAAWCSFKNTATPNWVNTIVPSFTCPSDTSYPKTKSANAPGNDQGFHGNHLLIAGNTSFNPTGPWSSTQLNGVAFALSAVKGKDVTDGLSKTMGVAEILVVPDNDTGWAAGDEDMRGRYHNSYEVLSCVSTLYTPNTSVADRVSNCNGTKIARAPCTAVGTTQHISSRSNHVSGVTVSFLDGSSRFVADAVDVTVYNAWGSRNGGEVAAND